MGNIFTSSYWHTPIKMVDYRTRCEKQTICENGTQNQTSFVIREDHIKKNGRLPRRSVAVFDCHKLDNLSIYGSKGK